MKQERKRELLVPCPFLSEKEWAQGAGWGTDRAGDLGHSWPVKAARWKLQGGGHTVAALVGVCWRPPTSPRKLKQRHPLKVRLGEGGQAGLSQEKRSEIAVWDCGKSKWGGNVPAESITGPLGIPHTARYKSSVLKLERSCLAYYIVF